MANQKSASSPKSEPDLPLTAHQAADVDHAGAPSGFTNQQLIDALYRAANRQGLSDWALLEKAGLDLDALAQARESRYGGVPLEELPALTAAERKLVLTELAAEIARESGDPAQRYGRITALAGLNLRAAPKGDASIIATLPDGTRLLILAEEGDWLHVAVGNGKVDEELGNEPSKAGTRGYVARAFVADDHSNEATAEPLTRPATTFFAADPVLGSMPLAPPEAQRIVTVPADGPGAQTLAQTWNENGGLLTELATRLGIDPAVAIAVLAVESNGVGFGPDGRMIIRFENHLFFHHWGQRNPTFFADHYTFDPNQSWLNHRWRPRTDTTFREFHGSQPAEWQVLTFSKGQDDTAAKLSISMGAPQILGSNHQRIGYPSVQAMFEAFSQEERTQILGLFDFIRTDAGLVQALRRNDYTAFARGYNGPGQADTYGTLIGQWVTAFNKLRPAPEGVAALPRPANQPALDPTLDHALTIQPELRSPEVYTQMTQTNAVNATPVATPAADSSSKTAVNNTAKGAAPSSSAFGSGTPTGRPISTPSVTPSSTSSVPSSVTSPGALPVPKLPVDTDPEVRAIWLKHIEQGFENNNIMFKRVLRAFMIPYYLTVALYVVLFFVGIGLFVIAARLSSSQETMVAGLLFGGMGVATFLTFFISKPMRSLEENLQFITWLGIVYNSYWTRLLYLENSTTVQAELADATQDAVAQIEHMLTRNVEVAGKRPGGE